MRIAREAFFSSVAGTMARRIRQKQLAETVPQFVRHPLQRKPTSRPGRALDAECVAIKMVVTLQGLDQEVVDGKPNWSAPVGISAEQAGCRFRRNIVDAMIDPTGRTDKRMIEMITGERANAVFR